MDTAETVAVVCIHCLKPTSAQRITHATYKIIIKTTQVTYRVTWVCWLQDNRNPDTQWMLMTKAKEEYRQTSAVRSSTKAKEKHFVPYSITIDKVIEEFRPSILELHSIVGKKTNHLGNVDGKNYIGHFGKLSAI